MHLLHTVLPLAALLGSSSATLSVGKRETSCASSAAFVALHEATNSPTYFCAFYSKWTSSAKNTPASPFHNLSKAQLDSACACVDQNYALPTKSGSIDKSAVTCKANDSRINKMKADVNNLGLFCEWFNSGSSSSAIPPVGDLTLVQAKHVCQCLKTYPALATAARATPYTSHSPATSTVPASGTTVNHSTTITSSYPTTTPDNSHALSSTSHTQSTVTVVVTVSTAKPTTITVNVSRASSSGQPSTLMTMTTTVRSATQ